MRCRVIQQEHVEAFRIEAFGQPLFSAHHGRIRQPHRVPGNFAEIAQVLVYKVFEIGRRAVVDTGDNGISPFADPFIAVLRVFVAEGDDVEIADDVAIAQALGSAGPGGGHYRHRQQKTQNLKLFAALAHVLSVRALKSTIILVDGEGTRNPLMAL